MFAALRDMTLMTTTGLAVKAVGMGVSSLDPETIAVAMGGLVIKRVRDLVRREPGLN